MTPKFLLTTFPFPSSHSQPLLILPLTYTYSQLSRTSPTWPEWLERVYHPIECVEFLPEDPGRAVSFPREAVNWGTPLALPPAKTGHLEAASEVILEANLDVTSLTPIVWVSIKVWRKQPSFWNKTDLGFVPNSAMCKVYELGHGLKFYNPQFHVKEFRMMITLVPTSWQHVRFHQGWKKTQPSAQGLSDVKHMWVLSKWYLTLMCYAEGVRIERLSPASSSSQWICLTQKGRKKCWGTM